MSAPDRVDRLILEIAEQEAPLTGSAAVVVVGDVTGALTAAALDGAAAGAPVLSWSESAHVTRGLRAEHPDALTSGRLRLTEDAGEDGEHGGLPAALADLGPSGDDTPTDGAGKGIVVLARLPRAVRAVTDLGLALAAGADGRPLDVVTGGRVKHMTRAFNPALERAFDHVHATRGSGSARCLVARGPRSDAPRAALLEGTATVPVGGSPRELSLRAIGDVFGGAAADPGSLLLLDALDAAGTGASGSVDGSDPGPADVLDLGCGNGLLTAYLAARLPDAAVHGSDDDLDAVRSTRSTLVASGLARDGVTVGWDDGLAGHEPGSVDLVLLNPPFHDGPGIDPTLVQGLLDAASRVLRRGGQLWLVHNSHLRYRTEVERRVGPVVQRARDRRFTVLSATRS